jgi:hypothetical protein
MQKHWPWKHQQQQGGMQQNSTCRSTGLGNTSSSSSIHGSSRTRVALPTEMLTAVLQTLIEAQVRSTQQLPA